jgi:uncharacterized membrane protein YkgB
MGEGDQISPLLVPSPLLDFFYSGAKVEHDEHVTRRIEVPELRSVRIAGKTESWTVSNDQQRESLQGAP